MAISTFIGSALAALLILSFIWWLAALSREKRRQQEQFDERNKRIHAHFQRNLAAARRIGIRTDDLEETL